MGQFRILIFLCLCSNYAFTQCEVFNNIIGINDTVHLSHNNGSYCSKYKVEVETDYTFSAEIVFNKWYKQQGVMFFVNGVEQETDHIKTDTSTIFLINWKSNLNTSSEVCVLAEESEDTSLSMKLSELNVGRVLSCKNALLKSFKLKNLKSNIILFWEVYAEDDLKVYEVEKSKDGENWQKIGVQQSKQANKRSQKYIFNDIVPYEGMNYYRLKMISNLDSVFYSDIRVINHEYFTNMVDYYISPIDKTIKLETFVPIKDLVLKDKEGQLLYFQKRTPKKHVISVPYSGKGTYYLVYKTYSGEHRREIIHNH